MKKFLIALLGVGLSFTMVACGDDTNDGNNDTDGDVELSADALAIETAKTRLVYTEGDITSGFTLFLTAVGDVTVSYVSSDSNVLEVDGTSAKVTRPAAGESDVTVKLTATLTKGTESDTKEFTFVVLAYEEGESSDVLTISTVRGLESGTSVTTRGVISGVVYNSSQEQAHCYLTDETGTIYIYGTTFAASVSIGDEVTITAEVSTHYDMVQVQYATIVTTHAKSVTPSLESAQDDKSITWIKENISNLGTNTFELEVTVNKYSTTSYTTYSLKDTDDNTFNLYSSGSNSSEFAFLDDYIDQTIKVVVVVQGTSNSGNPRGQVIAIVTE